MQVSKDLVPFCSHSIDLYEGSNVKELFDSSRTSSVSTADGRDNYTNIYAAPDFLLTEIRQLRLRRADFDPRDRSFDGTVGYLTLDEFCRLATALQVKSQHTNNVAPNLLLTFPLLKKKKKAEIQKRWNLCRSKNATTLSRSIQYLYRSCKEFRSHTSILLIFQLNFM